MTDQSRDTETPAAPSVAEGRPAQGRRQLIWLAIFASVLLVLIYGVPALFRPRMASTPAADDAAAFRLTDQQWAGLKILPVRKVSFSPAVRADGRIALDDELSTSVYSPYSGRVTRILARVGDVVVAGAPMLVVHSNELAQGQNDLVSALATLRTAEAQLELSVGNERRQHQLYLAHGAALKDWQQSRADLANARGQLSSARIAVDSVRNRLGILGLTQAEITRINDAPTQQGAMPDSIVRAPISGTVLSRTIGPGQNIVGTVASAGAATAPFTISDLSKVWLVAYAREEDAGRFHPGDEAVASVAPFPGRSFHARVTYVAPVIDPNTHRLLVRAEVDNPGLELKPDMLATFRIITARAFRVLAVPAYSVVYEGADARVWVADPARRTLEVRQIRVGSSFDGMVNVLAGLAPGDQVVTSGAVFIDRALSGN